MSYVKNVFISCLLAFFAIGLQAATQKPETPSTPIETTTPSSIIVKQTGKPSWKTFYKVPVEVSIMNNTDEAFGWGAPYLSGVSVWNSSSINQKLANLCGTVSGLCCKAAILVWIASGMATLLDMPLAYKNIHLANLIDPMSRHTPDVFLTGAFNKLLEVGMLMWGISRVSVKPHETVSINGYISTADIQKIQSSKKSNHGNTWQFIALA